MIKYHFFLVLSIFIIHVPCFGMNQKQNLAALDSAKNDEEVGCPFCYNPCSYAKPPHLSQALLLAYKNDAQTPEQKQEAKILEKKIDTILFQSKKDKEKKTNN